MARIAWLVMFLAGTVAFADDAADDAKAKAAALKTALKSGTPDEKKGAIAACASVKHAVSAAALGPVLADPSDELRIAAAQSLGSMAGLPEAAKALAGGVAPNAKKPEVLKAIFKGMASVNHSAAVPALKEFADKRVPLKDDKESETVVASIEALSQIKWKASVEVLLDLYTKQVGVGMDCSKGHHQPVYSAIMRGVEGFAGKSFQMPGDAKAWWSKRQKEVNDDLTEKKR